MEISEATVKYPTKVCRFGGSKSLMLTKTMSPNKANTASNDPSILNCKKHLIVRVKDFAAAKILIT